VPHQNTTPRRVRVPRRRAGGSPHPLFCPVPAVFAARKKAGTSGSVARFRRHFTSAGQVARCVRRSSGVRPFRSVPRIGIGGRETACPAGRCNSALDLTSVRPSPIPLTPREAKRNRPCALPTALFSLFRSIVNLQIETETAAGLQQPWYELNPWNHTSHFHHTPLGARLLISHRAAPFCWGLLASPCQLCVSCVPPLTVHLWSTDLLRAATELSGQLPIIYQLAAGHTFIRWAYVRVHRGCTQLGQTQPGTYTTHVGRGRPVVPCAHLRPNCCANMSEACTDGLCPRSRSGGIGSSSSRVLSGPGSLIRQAILAGIDRRRRRCWLLLAAGSQAVDGLVGGREAIHQTSDNWNRATSSLLVVLAIDDDGPGGEQQLAWEPRENSMPLCFSLRR
jgi:hypothetical protein